MDGIDELFTANPLRTVTTVGNIGNNQEPLTNQLKLQIKDFYRAPTLENPSLAYAKDVQNLL